MSVVRIDEKNHRLFVVPNQPSQEAIISRLNSSAECFKKSSWSNDWSVSLFINKKYAGYKDEPKIIEYHQNNEWAKAYIGEFDGPSKTYTKSPALKP